jgi:hypothetical protein
VILKVGAHGKPEFFDIPLLQYFHKFPVCEEMFAGWSPVDQTDGINIIKSRQNYLFLIALDRMI